MTQTPVRPLLDNLLQSLRADIEQLQSIASSEKLTADQVTMICQTILESAPTGPASQNALTARVQDLRLLHHTEEAQPFKGPERLERIIGYLQQIEPITSEVVKKPDDFPTVRNKLNELCTALLREINMLEILRTFNKDVLKPMRIGYVYDFLKEYQVLLPKIEDRLEVLRELQRNRQTLGYVDLDNGVIYRISRNRRNQAGSYLLIASIIIAGAVIMLGLQWLVVSGTSIGIGNLEANLKSLSASQLLLLYAAMASGFICHTIKKSLEKGKTNPLLDEMLQWIYVKYMDFVKSAVLLLIVFAGLATIKAPADGQPFLTVFEALVAGFAVDSIGETVIQRYNAKTSETLKTLTDLVGASSSSV
jgi:hypothetical protein